MKIFIILAIILLALSQAQLTLKTSFDMNDYDENDYYVTTGSGRYLIQYEYQSFKKFYDLEDNGQAITPSITNIKNFAVVPGDSNKIATLQSNSVIRIYTLPDLSYEDITMNRDIDTSYSYAQLYYRDDGARLYFYYEEQIQLFSFEINMVSDVKSMSEVCDNINFASNNKYFPYPAGNTITVRSHDSKICIVDYSTWHSFTAEKGEQTVGQYTPFGYWTGDKQIIIDMQVDSNALVHNILDDALLFTYTLREGGPFEMQMSTNGKYWIGELYSQDFIVGDTSDYCKYQATPAQFSGLYDVYMNEKTLIIVEDETTVYAYDIGETWSDMESCTSNSASLPTAVIPAPGGGGGGNPGVKEQNNNSTLLSFSALALILAANLI